MHFKLLSGTSESSSSVVRSWLSSIILKTVQPPLFLYLTYPSSVFPITCLGRNSVIYLSSFFFLSVSVAIKKFSG